jgi:hypothetical protein
MFDDTYRVALGEAAVARKSRHGNVATKKRRVTTGELFLGLANGVENHGKMVV